jgi:hypothetical protein
MASGPRRSLHGSERERNTAGHLSVARVRLSVVLTLPCHYATAQAETRYAVYEKRSQLRSRCAHPLSCARTQGVATRPAFHQTAELHSRLRRLPHNLSAAGDTALLKSNETLPYVAEIQGIQFDKKGLLHVRCGWYFRPEDLDGGRKMWHGQQELFRSELTGPQPTALLSNESPLAAAAPEADPACRMVAADLNPIESIMQRVEVVDLETYKRMATSAKDKARSDVLHYSRFSYDMKTRQPKEAEVKNTPTFCTCKQPENPDRLMVCCESCDAWFHGGALLSVVRVFSRTN